MNLTWAYRSKTNAEGGLSQRKSRCCVQGFSQTYQTNFAETYASTPYWTEIAGESDDEEHGSRDPEPEGPDAETKSKAVVLSSIVCR